MNFFPTSEKEQTRSKAIDTLRLIRSENVGPITFHGLVARFGDAGRALEALPDLANRGGSKRRIRVCPKTEAVRELEAGKRTGAQLLIHGNDDYPKPMIHLDDAPPALWAKGNIDLLARQSIGIVGSRNASAAGIRIAQKIAHDLGEKGFLVTSGMARGIDGAVHAATISTATCAVLAGGVDHVYPPQHTDLYSKIVEHGVVISEMPMGTTAQARHFPRRNRLVSGMSLGVLVVEAALRSGSLITARLASDQGRSVFAIPGSPLDPRSSGTNNLIKNGAHLTENADDIIDVLAPMTNTSFNEPDMPPAPTQWSNASVLQDPVSETEIEMGMKIILSLLGPVPVDIDVVIRLSNLPPEVVLNALIELELAGRLSRQADKKVSLLDQWL